MSDTWPDGSPKVPVTLCWHCDRALDAASGFGPTEGMVPHPGAISLCMYCGAIAIFGSDLRLYPLTEAELDDMRTDESFMTQYMSFAWARQYVMIKESLMREREDPDR